MKQIDDKAIGKRLLKLRQKLEIEPDEAASLAGVSVRSWRKWEAGSPMRTLSFLKVC